MLAIAIQHEEQAGDVDAKGQALQQLDARPAKRQAEDAAASVGRSGASSRSRRRRRGAVAAAAGAGRTHADERKRTRERRGGSKHWHRRERQEERGGKETEGGEEPKVKVTRIAPSRSSNQV